MPRSGRRAGLNLGPETWILRLARNDKAFKGGRQRVTRLRFAREPIRPTLPYAFRPVSRMMNLRA